MSAESDSSRRDFLKTTASAGLAALGGVTFIPRPGRVFGANDRVRVAVCGLHGRGKDHLAAFSHVPNVEIAALCDVDENVLNKQLGRVAGGPQTFVDVRKLLEDKSIDAISIAMPNHWHSLMAIWACQAGKDVYVEKPCSHNLWEGRQLVRAAQKYQRIVQHGTQIRSAPAVREAIKQVQQRGHRRGLPGARPMLQVAGHDRACAAEQPFRPASIMIFGRDPRPLKPFTQNRFHYNWHWIWDTGNGDLGNQGVHQVDLARWGLGLKFPNRISAVGGHFMFDDDQQTPNTLNCAFEFDLPDGKRRMMEFEVRHWITNREAGIGEAGLVAAGEHDITTRSATSSMDRRAISPPATRTRAATRLGWATTRQPGPHGHGSGDHFANFIDCVRSRKPEDLNAPIEEGYISAGLVHLANASYRLGRTLRFDPESEQVIDDDEANKLLRDGDREYRPPFVVPEDV